MANEISNITIDGTNYTIVDTDAVRKSEVGSSIATLVDGKVPASQLPSFVDDVIEGYYSNGQFYEDEAHTSVITPEGGKIYVDVSTEKCYRYSGSAYVEISNGGIGSVTFTRSLTSGTKVGTLKVDGTETVLYAPTNTDTKNTAGSTNSTSKLYLIGATEQGDNPQTYSYSGLTIENGALAQGYNAIASGSYSHAEGYATFASGSYSHAEGHGTTASGDCSHAEGSNIIASGDYSHAEGGNTTASSNYSHAEGRGTTASGGYSHAQNFYTVASSKYQTALGQFNIEDTADTYAVIVGNGTAFGHSNALTLDWSGNVVASGDVTATDSDGNTVSLLNISGSYVSSVNGQTGDVVLTAEDVSALPDTTTIPSKTSDLANDSGYITSDDVPTVSVNPIKTSGTEIAEITVGDTTSKIYAPNGSGGEEKTIGVGDTYFFRDVLCTVGNSTTSGSIGIQLTMPLDDAVTGVSVSSIGSLRGDGTTKTISTSSVSAEILGNDSYVNTRRVVHLTVTSSSLTKYALYFITSGALTFT